MAGDPDDYSRLLWTEDLPVLQGAVLDLINRLEADGRPAQALLVIKAFREFRAKLDVIARETAEKAKKEIYDEQLRSRVRDDTGMEGSGESLADWVGESDPLPQVPGAVGINNEKILYDEVPWWWTNEEGYDGHVGREIQGVFYDVGWTDVSAPNQADKGRHPLFAAIPTGGVGTIDEPIPAREFVRKGSDLAADHWHGAIDAAVAALVAETSRAQALARSTPRTHAPRPLRRRRP